MRKHLSRYEFLTRRSLAKGFTLVELLIVIALLGVIATIVIAAINPIEQANRAHDSQFKSDASQLLSAIERYYVANSNKYPWQGLAFCGPGGSTACTTELSYGFWSVGDFAKGVGVCSTTGCTTDGLLVTALEMKSAFRGRNFVTSTGTADTKIWVGKETGSGSSVYACYQPLSKTNRKAACTENVVYTLTTSGTRAPVGNNGNCGAATGTDPTWLTGGTDATSAWYVCVPQ